MSGESLTRRVFLEVHQALPRAGPGNRESTARALAACLPLPESARVVDAGCGPGRQTLHLAELLPAARIVALDRHLPFLATAMARTRAAGFAARVLPVAGDMRALPAADGSVDLLWCEGAAYAIGLERALTGWCPLLVPGGHLAFTEAVWLTEEIPDELRRWWQAAYPQMRSREDCLALVERSGYRLIDSFALPPAAWWDDYYVPMEARVAELRARYAAVAEALHVLDQCQAEIEVYRRWSDCYGYLFVVAAREAAD